MSWSHWSYKATAGGVPNSWGIYDPTGTWPSVPNIQSDSMNTISNDWSKWKTRTAFGTTSFLIRYLGAPLAVADFYTNSGTLTVSSNSGVLANDQDINLGQSGINLTAVLVSNPANGLSTPMVHSPTHPMRASTEPTRFGTGTLTGLPIPRTSPRCLFWSRIIRQVR